MEYDIDRVSVAEVRLRLQLRFLKGQQRPLHADGRQKHKVL